MKYIAIVDFGHRKDTPGKAGNDLYEYEFNEYVGRLLANKLNKYCEVYYTIETDKHPYSELTSAGRTQNLSYRATNANNVYWNAVKKYGKNNFKIVFVSIHANAFSDPSVSGYEIFVYKHGSEAHELSKAIHKQAQLELGVGTDINDRGIKEANFYVLSNTIMPAVLVEHEFYTNSQAAKKLKSSTFREKCATHLYRGILDYMGIKYAETPIGGENVLYRIRKTWEDSKSQKGAYLDSSNAITEAKKHEGYKVYDDNGNQVYPEVKLDNNSGIVYKVQVGVYSVKESAENTLEQLKQAGFNGFITEEIIKQENKPTIPEKPKEPEKPIIEEVKILEYKGLVKKGSHGDNVKELQQVLNKLGYNVGTADGIAGNNTITQIKQLQKNYSLTSDGMAGQATYNKINELLSGKPINKPNQSTDKNKYYKFKNAHVIEVEPLDLYIDTVKKVNKNIKGDFINGSLFSMKTLKSVSTLVNNGQVIAEQLPHDNVKRGTFIVWKDGTVSVEMIDFISKYSKLKDIKFAIGGFNIMPKNKNMRQQLKSEWFDYNTVGYKTWRSMLGYSKKKNKILVVIVPNTNADEGQVLMKDLGCDCAISLDSGGSTSGRFNGKTIRTTARKIHNIVRW